MVGLGFITTFTLGYFFRATSNLNWATFLSNVLQQFPFSSRDEITDKEQNQRGAWVQAGGISPILS